MHEFVDKLQRAGFGLTLCWHVEWMRRFEYWQRCQLGPFYVLWPYSRAYWAAIDAENEAAIGPAPPEGA